MPSLQIVLEPEEYEQASRVRRRVAAECERDLSWIEFFNELVAREAKK